MMLTPKNERLRRDIGACLHVTGALSPYLLPEVHAVGSALIGEIDKEVKTSAEATFIAACNKLDDLIAGLGNYETETAMEAKLVEGADADIESRKQIALTSRHARRPSVLYQASITKNVYGAWVAYYGDLSVPEACVIGVGNTVEAAMQNFDKDWFAKAAPVEQSEATQTPKNHTSKSRKKK